MLFRMDQIMKKFDPMSYTINDFLEWKNRDQLILVNKFQRRSVWKPVAKSFLIDSIIRGIPLPKIFIRQITDVKNQTTKREVIDGQQRLRAIFEFINDGFPIRISHNSDYGGMNYSNLPEEIKESILTYKLSVDNIIGLDDSEIMDIFARLNTYSVKLNSQELINAKYFGLFKQLVYDLGHKYNTFWIDNKIFTEYQVMRMMEVELTADIIIGMLDGVQFRKNAKLFYDKYEEKFDERFEITNKFHETIAILCNIFQDRFKDSIFRKQSLFYSLFLAIYSINNELIIYKDKNKICMNIDNPNISKLLFATDIIEDIVNTKNDIGRKELEFVDSISKKTNDTSIRQLRTQFIIDVIYDVLFEKNYYSFTS